MSLSSRSGVASSEALGATFDGLLRAVEDRSRLVGVRRVWLEMAGRPVRLSIAGERIAEIFLTAYRHLLLDPEDEPKANAPAALDIEVWDETACNWGRPIRYLRDCLPRSRPFGRAVLGQSGDSRVLGYQSHSLFGILDLEKNRLVAAVEDVRRLSLFERGKPLQPLLFAWHGAIGAMPLHAGLVARQGRGVLLGGAGGSGKSTTSLLCWQAGFDYLGDDYIALPSADAGGRYTGYSLYTSTWLTPDHSRRFPRLAEKAHYGNEAEDKLLVLLNEVDDTRLTRSSPVNALVLPRIVGGSETTYRPASRSEAVRRLAPSSILQLPFIDGQAALNRMHELVQAVPCFWLDLGTDFPGIPRAVMSILSEVSDG
ncbi:MAG: hypothetical protein A3F70_14880 [Acidobacteria bacterium RIFCSPLOWO2_12_FULL_67_14]|nr:MAG: hypothetical protein A3H29_08800 [Acidobacteria bacterium RIFCSPLOWO2_02_FULL_67_21]OFW37516.1 MAG: hypothetical protein A3F70_14880 [Acidobacteria bacterium RIFCSPLOWO2_12_FULL_67_14]